ncbi:MAG: 3-deoxy-7-phosphoheptulonate synthase [Polyangiales bacterium]
MTLNFIRSSSDSGFADLSSPGVLGPSFMESARSLRQPVASTSALCARWARRFRFMQALGEQTVDELTRVEFFTSHEGLNLHYESAQTRRVPRRDGWYDLTTHLPLDRCTHPGALDGAHVEFFRGVRNPVGIKIGPKATPDVLRLVERLNPNEREAGRFSSLRLGADAWSAHCRYWSPLSVTPAAGALMRRPDASGETPYPRRAGGSATSRRSSPVAPHPRCARSERDVHFGGVTELTGDDV